MARKLSFATASFFFTLLFLFANSCHAMNVENVGITQNLRPEQPATGPGGAEYQHSKIMAYHFGSGRDEYWIYEPADPVPDSAPVIVFFHGWGALMPSIHGSWIRHIVRRGNIVIFPRYQVGFMDDPAKMYDAAINSVLSALDELRKPDHVVPELDKFAIVGHSFGGAITANVASRWEEMGLPAVRAAMSVEPGDPQNAKSKKFIPKDLEGILVDTAGIKPDTIFIVVAGADDGIVGDIGAKIVYKNAVNVPPERKNFFLFHTDNFGTPPLDADHMMPLAADEDFTADFQPDGDHEKGFINEPGTKAEKFKNRLSGGNRDKFLADAYDFYGLWRIFDAMTECAFYDLSCDRVLGDGENVTYMGEWSDGTPVRELQVGIDEQKTD